MPWTDLLGHTDQIDRFRKSVTQGRLAHAYAFVGPAGVGKKYFALLLARCLLCERHSDAELVACGACPSCQQVLAGTHPDLFVVGLPEGKKELPIKLFVGEDEKRGSEGLCHDLSLKPMTGRRRIAIIDDADYFNDASGNALLKTLEEPPQHSLLILIATSLDLLLPTIRSRCQVLTFGPLSDANLETLLAREEGAPAAAEIAEIVPLATGSLDTARQLLDPELRGQRRVLYDALAAERYRSTDIAARVLAGVNNAGAEKSDQRQYASWVIRFCVEFFRQALRALARSDGGASQLPQVTQFLSRLPVASLAASDLVADLLDRCLAAEWQLDGNVMIPVCMEALFDDLGRIMRTG